MRHRLSLAIGFVIACIASPLTVLASNEQSGGQVAGQVTSAATGAPIANVNVSLYNASGAFAASWSTDASGNYITPTVPAGTYFAKTFNTLGFIDELYDNIVCLSSSG